MHAKVRVDANNGENLQLRIIDGLVYIFRPFRKYDALGKNEEENERDKGKTENLKKKKKNCACEKYDEEKEKLSEGVDRLFQRSSLK